MLEPIDVIDYFPNTVYQQVDIKFRKAEIEKHKFIGIVRDRTALTDVDITEMLKETGLPDYKNLSGMLMVTFRNQDETLSSDLVLTLELTIRGDKETTLAGNLDTTLVYIFECMNKYVDLINNVNTHKFFMPTYGYSPSRFESTFPG